jgi:hypothetical protein
MTKYTINELANSKGVSPLVREALLQMADYKQLYEQVCEQYDVLAKELEATNRQVEILSDALAESRRECKWPTCQSEEYQQALAEQIKQELVTGAAQQEHEPENEPFVSLASVQEPVAWMFEDDEDNGHKTFIQTPPSPEVVAYLAKWNRPAWVPLYTTPPAAQPAPVQKPVAWANPNDLKNFDMKVRTNGGPLHTVPLCLCTPPAAQRQWVGLTHDEFIDLCEEAGNFGSGSLIRHIEAKLKEKNT